MRHHGYKDLLLTQVQASEITGISRTSIHAAIKDGRVNLATRQSGAVSRKYFDWKALMQLLEAFPQKKRSCPKFRRKFFGNLKGGAGKTIVSAQYAMASSASGIRTLMIDLDPQAHATLALLRSRIKQDQPTILDCFKGHPVEKVARKVTPFLDIIPSHLELSVGEAVLFQDLKRGERLKMFLDSIDDRYDQFIFDTAPSAGILTTNALVAATEIICVTETEFYSVQGLQTFFRLLRQLGRDFQITKNIKIVPNQHSLNSRDSEEAMAFLRTQKDYKTKVTDTSIRENADLKESHKLGIPVWVHKAKSQGAKDILSLSNELMV